MHVLGAGSGARDVAFLCASLAGPAVAAVETVFGTARSAGTGNVTFAAAHPL